MLKRLLLGAIASLAVLSPASAEVQEGTYDLIETVQQHMTVSIDSPWCDSTPDADGGFSPGEKKIYLCTRGDVDANDHDTVRHEVWHVIQWCITPDNERYLRTVIKPGTAEWQEYVTDHLTPRRVQWIKDNYPRPMWYAEIEAFSAAKMLDASQIEKLFIKACVK